MGADMIIACVVRPENENPEELKKKVLERIDELTADEVENMSDFFEEAYGSYPETYTIGEDKDIMRKVLEEGLKCITSGYRDMTMLFHKGDVIHITGGMSWGDSPTDSYSALGDFSSLLYHLGMNLVQEETE